MNDPTVIIVGIVVVVALIASMVWLRRLGGASQASEYDTVNRIPISLAPDEMIQVQTLVAQRKKLEAIKFVREKTNRSLKEAKDFVDALPRLGEGSAGPAAQAELLIDPALIANDSVMRELLAQNNKIAAIKRVRELTNWGLKEAKDFVDALPPVSVPANGQAAAPTLLTDREQIANDGVVRALLAQNNKIAAIQRVRELTNWGLKEAKDFVDSLS